MNAYETIDAILRGVIQTPGATVWGGKMMVQNDPIVTEDTYVLRYVTIYNPPEGFPNVEAYVLINKDGISLFDFTSDELYLGGKFIGIRRDVELIDKVVADYELERGRNMGSPGAGDAYYNALVEMAGV